MMKMNLRDGDKMGGTFYSDIGIDEDKYKKCPCDFCNGKKYTVQEYLNHIDELTED